MTHPNLGPWLVELEHCPASAVEQPLVQELYQQDPLFFTALSRRQRWQLLAGLHITLLDYKSSSFSPLGFEAQPLQLPVRHMRLPLSQVLHAALKIFSMWMATRYLYTVR